MTPTRSAWTQWLTRHSWIGPLVALAALYIVFSLLAPDTFPTGGNVRTMIRQTTVVGIAALGMTMIVILGGIDLSVGSLVALTTIIVAALLQAGAAPLTAAAGGVLAAAACGLCNGLLITRLRVMPFIVTLGAMGIIRGAAKGLAHEQKIDAPVTWLNGVIAELPAGSRWQVFPPGVWLLLLLALVVGGVLRYTRLGRHIFAIG
jgi:ribose transport system permease protein